VEQFGQLRASLQARKFSPNPSSISTEILETHSRHTEGAGSLEIDVVKMYLRHVTKVTGGGSRTVPPWLSSWNP